jgi:hypothetical protein
MGYVIEEKKEFFTLRTAWKKGAYLSVITNNDRVHPKLARPIAIYVHPLNKKAGYIISVEHNEGRQIDLALIQDLVFSIETVYVLDKIKFLYYFKHKNVIDVNILKSYLKHEDFIKEGEDKLKNWYYAQDADFIDVNLTVPLTKHYEIENAKFQKFKKDFKNTHFYESKGFKFLNDDCTKVFHLLSKNPLGIDKKSFVKFYKVQKEEYNFEERKVYSYYNLHSVTGRPSNSFNNINFLAIPKNNEVRTFFKPLNDKFLELDFDGYHIRLVADAIGFPLTEESAHIQLAKLYNPGEEITDELYSKAKQTNFEALYGKVPKEYEHLEFYQKLTQFIADLWSKFNSEGSIEVPKSHRVFEKDNKNALYPSKLFNYYVQSLETGRNVEILKKVLFLLHNKESFLALYTYDSIIIDFSLKDGKQTVEEIKNYMEEKGKYPIRVKESSDFYF